MPALKVKEIQELLCAEGEKVVFSSPKPNLPGKPGIIQIAYILKEDNSFDVWFNDEREENHGWYKHLSNVRPKKTEAMAHYDGLRWAEFSKETAKFRKERIKPEDDADQEKLRRAVRYFYDLQKLRNQSGNRDSNQAAPAVLEAENKEFLGRHSVGLEALEKSVLRGVEQLLQKFPIYTEWLVHQKGCGPTMSGVLVAEIDINNRRELRFKQVISDLKNQLEDPKLKGEERAEVEEKLEKYEKRLAVLSPCDTISSLWAYAGLAVDPETGLAVRREKGKVANWNPFLKTKALWVLGGSFLKCESPWRRYYDEYKHRKTNELVERCMVCKGLGALIKFTPAEEGQPGSRRCYRCKGKKFNVPWGKSKNHIHVASMRYMVKMFLAELWIQWRTLEGLPVTESYAEAKLGRKHGDHAPKGNKDPDDSEE